MMSTQEILRLSDEAEARAKRENKKPRIFGTYIAERRDFLAREVRGIPFVGKYLPADFERVPRAELRTPETMSPQRLTWLGCDDEFVFVDSSGFGARDEPALTFDEFVDLVAANPGLGWGIVESGQFQVVIGAARKLEGVQAPKLPKRYTRDDLIKAFARGEAGRGHNASTDGRVFTLHATDICWRESDGVGRDRLVFNWGGWYTRLTARYMAKIMLAFGLRPWRYLDSPGEAAKMGRDHVRINLWEEVAAQ